MKNKNLSKTPDSKRNVKSIDNNKIKTDESISKDTIKNIEKVNKRYFSFSSRLIVNIVIFVVTIVVGVFLLMQSITLNTEKMVNYKETSNLDYKVYLLPNSFYEEKYLGKNMLYVASLIDNIEIYFDYNFRSNFNIDMDYTYNILADLVITNKEGTRSYYQKKYVLLEDQNLKMNDGNIQNIKEKININYSHYNSLANSFKSSFGVETDSKLNVYMTVNKKNKDFNLDENNKMNITIPLSEKSVDIQMKYNNINNSNNILQNKEMFINNYMYFSISVIMIITSIVFLIKILKKILLLRTKHSVYDKHLDRLLKEYDRLIAETTTLMPFEDKNIVKVKAFTELLDIHDNLQLPIIYYNVTKHHKCYFYISHNDTVYLFVLKAIDLEVSKNANQK